MWWLLLAFFTPSQTLFSSSLDGAWEFGQVAERRDPQSATTEYLVKDELIALNNSQSPTYLVENKLEWHFAGAGETWLVMEFEAWSEETEAGFDDPALVVFLGEEIIWRENSFEACCEVRQERVYLGNLSGEHTLSFFAGEMGDLHKPTGVVFSRLVLEITSQEPMTQNTSMPMSLTERAQVSPPPSQKHISTPKPVAPATYVNFNNPQKTGQTQETTDDRKEVETPFWPEWLRALVFHRWFFGLLWLGILVVTVFVRLTVYRTSRKEHL